MKRFCFTFIFVTATWLSALAAANVTTQLSADETSVGTPVTMQVSVDGTTNVSLPGKLDVEGLDVRLTGRSTMVQVINGVMTTSGVYTYTIFPLREGTFEIPALELNVDGHQERTSSQKLLVQSGGVSAPRPAPAMPIPPGGQINPKKPSPNKNVRGQLAYAEMIVPKKTIYVGEVVPVELHFYFANDDRNPQARVRFRALQDEPIVSGEGFTVQKLSPATRAEEVIGDIKYLVLTYKTSITAVKSGEMNIPTAAFHGVLSVPVDGPPGMESMFNQMFGGQIASGFTDDQEVKLESETKPIQVKAIPAEGRPTSFSGAVGDFTISAAADPLKTSAGDPINLKVTISGSGNFDAMGEPKLLHTEGWRVYPATDRFEKADVIGFGGKKTFETPMVAQQPQTQTPVAEFSYFDPDKAKFFTITSQPVSVEAEAAASSNPQVSTATAATPSVTPTAMPESDAVWIEQFKYRSWQPTLKSPVFWAINGVAVFILTGLITIQAVRRSKQSPNGQRAVRVRHRDHLLNELRHGNLKDETFCTKALEMLTLQAELKGESGPFEWVRTLENQGQEVKNLQTVLAYANELKFSGGLITQIDAEERNRIVKTLSEVCR